MLGVGLAVLSALSFSLNSVMARRGLARAAASAGAFITVLLGVPLFLFASLVTGQLFHAGDVALSGYILLAAAGILHFGVGRYFNYRASAAIGATRAQTVQALTVPYAVGVAWWTLGEPVSPIMGLGIILILVGPTIMLQRNRTQRPTAPRGGSTSSPTEAFQLKQVQGYASALMTVFAYGTSPILIRAALEGVTGVSIYGGFIAYSAAAIVLMLTLPLPGRRDTIAAMNFSTVRLFLSAGVMVFFAQMFRFMALSLAPVAVVTPIMRTGAIYTLFFSWLINRELEAINVKVIVGIAFSVAGAMLLAFYG